MTHGQERVTHSDFPLDLAFSSSFAAAALAFLPFFLVPLEGHGQGHIQSSALGSAGFTTPQNPLVNLTFYDGNGLMISTMSNGHLQYTWFQAGIVWPHFR